jgi:3-oxosteroid 1-dehydrogenase
MTDVDIICVGAGLGGLAAAIRAHDLGARVLVLERSDLVGGVAAYSGGFCWVGGNRLADPPDSLDAAEAYLDHVQGSGRPVDRAARRRYLESSAQATQWFADAGIPFNLIRKAPDLYAPCPGSTAQGRLLECAVAGADLGEWRPRLRPSPYYRTGVSRDEFYYELGGDVAARVRLAASRSADDHLTHGLGLMGAFVREALVRRGVECRLSHRVVRLLQRNGRVVGVVAEGPDGEVEITAGKGVLLAVGGYGNAPDAAELEDVPELVEAAPPVVAGDGLSLAQSVGAAVVRGADPFVVLGERFEGQTHPGTDEPMYTQLLEFLGYPHSMIVNSDGQRFGDESYYGALIRGLRQYDARRKRWANYPCWLVFDESFHEQYPLGPYDPGAPYPAEVRTFGSLDELAAGTGMDREGLRATIERFNRYAGTGEDLEHARGSLPFARSAYGDPRYVKNPNLGPVERPPFHAVRLTVLGVGLSTLGLGIDADARVLRRDGSVIEGLYATGNAAATRELKGYVTGLANARNYTYAYNAVGSMLT